VKRNHSYYRSNEVVGERERERERGREREREKLTKMREKAKELLFVADKEIWRRKEGPSTVDDFFFLSFCIDFGLS
jgi:hypothetical protein